MGSFHADFSAARPLDRARRARSRGLIPRAVLVLAAPALLAFPCGGCLAPQSRVDALQTQNRSLAEQTRAQLAEIENLRIHSRNVEDQLQRTEEEMALLEDRVGVDGRGLADVRQEHEALKRQLRGEPGALPKATTERLAAFSQQHPELKFDPQAGVAKFNTDILFDSGKDELKPGANDVLAQLAATLKSSEASELRLMVVGHTDDRQMARRPARERFPTNFDLSTARAVAVARRLRELGVESSRMGVAGFASHQPIAPNTSEENRGKNRRVELFVMAPNVPVIGWAETLPSVY